MNDLAETEGSVGRPDPSSPTAYAAARRCFSGSPRPVLPSPRQCVDAGEVRDGQYTLDGVTHRAAADGRRPVCGAAG